MTKPGVRYPTTASYYTAFSDLADVVQTVKEGFFKTSIPLNYSITVQETTGVSPLELSFGRRLRMKLGLLQPNIEGRVHKKQEAFKERYDQNTQLREFPLGVSIYIKLEHYEQWQPTTVLGSQFQIVS